MQVRFRNYVGCCGCITGARSSRTSFYFFRSSLWLSTAAPQPRKMASRVGLFLLFGMPMVASPEARLLSFRWDVKHELDFNNKLVIAINGKTPGPIVQAKRGDTIVVKATNSLVKDNLAIRWDGLRQIVTPSCRPILAGETCTYRLIGDRVRPICTAKDHGIIISRWGILVRIGVQNAKGRWIVWADSGFAIGWPVRINRAMHKQRSTVAKPLVRKSGDAGQRFSGLIKVCLEFMELFDRMLLLALFIVVLPFVMQDNILRTR